MRQILFAFLWAITGMWGLIQIAPGLKTKSYRLHAVTLIVMTALNTSLRGNNLVHVLIYYLIIMLWLIIVYRLSSFVTASTAVLFFTAQLLAAIITSNVSIFTLNRVIDFRILFSTHDLYVVLTFTVAFVLVVKYYHVLMLLFRNVVAIDSRNQRIIAFSDVLVFSAFILYQKYTFVNLTSMVFVSGVVLSKTVLDYILYSYLALTVVAMILIFFINRQLITSNNLAKYKFKAEVDPMTGVLSRDAGIRYLKDAIFKASRAHTELTIAYIDVNDLKIVNDKYGHNEGDHLLRHITEIVQSNLRDLDVIARLGGDEFMIVFTKCNTTQASKVWGRIQDEFAQVNRNGNLPYGISASVGFTQYDPEKHKTVSALLHEADAEMYHQKKSSKSRLSSRGRTQ